RRGWNCWRTTARRRAAHTTPSSCATATTAPVRAASSPSVATARYTLSSVLTTPWARHGLPVTCNSGSRHEQAQHTVALAADGRDGGRRRTHAGRALGRRGRAVLAGRPAGGRRPGDPHA